jgi:hypothetical protein
MADKKEPLKCGKCGAEIRYSGKLDQHAISKALGSQPICVNCVPPQFKRALTTHLAERN